MSSQELFTVQLFAPSSCPACLAPFSGPDDLGHYAPGDGGSFVEALSDLHKRFPEIYLGENGTQALDADFIRCAHCENISLRLHRDTYTGRHPR